MNMVDENLSEEEFDYEDYDLDEKKENELLGEESEEEEDDNHNKHKNIEDCVDDDDEPILDLNAEDDFQEESFEETRVHEKFRTHRPIDTKDEKIKETIVEPSKKVVDKQTDFNKNIDRRSNNPHRTFNRQQPYRTQRKDHSSYRSNRPIQKSTVHNRQNSRDLSSKSNEIRFNRSNSNTNYIQPWANSPTIQATQPSPFQPTQPLVNPITLPLQQYPAQSLDILSTINAFIPQQNSNVFEPVSQHNSSHFEPPHSQPLLPTPVTPVTHHYQNNQSYQQSWDEPRYSNDYQQGNQYRSSDTNMYNETPRHNYSQYSSQEPSYGDSYERSNYDNHLNYDRSNYDYQTYDERIPPLIDYRSSTNNYNSNSQNYNITSNQDKRYSKDHYNYENRNKNYDFNDRVSGYNDHNNISNKRNQNVAREFDSLGSLDNNSYQSGPPKRMRIDLNSKLSRQNRNMKSNFNNKQYHVNKEKHSSVSNNKVINVNNEMVEKKMDTGIRSSGSVGNNAALGKNIRDGKMCIDQVNQPLEEEEEDEETRQYRKKIEEQKRTREIIFKLKEERRLKALAQEQQQIEEQLQQQQKQPQLQQQLPQKQNLQQQRPQFQQRDQDVKQQQQKSPQKQQQRPRPQQQQQRAQPQQQHPQQRVRLQQQQSLQPQQQQQSQQTKFPQPYTQQNQKNQQHNNNLMSKAKQLTALPRPKFGNSNQNLRITRPNNIVLSCNQDISTLPEPENVVVKPDSSFMKNRKVILKNAASTSLPNQLSIPSIKINTTITGDDTDEYDIPKKVVENITNDSVNPIENNDPQLSSSFFHNRTVIAKGKPLLRSKKVVVSNLSASTTNDKLMEMTKRVGQVQTIQLEPQERQATILFKNVASAHAFYRRYHRYVLDLSVIEVKLEPIL